MVIIIFAPAIAISALYRSWGAGVARYAFTVTDLHRLPSAGLPAHPSIHDARATTRKLVVLDLVQPHIARGWAMGCRRLAGLETSRKGTRTQQHAGLKAKADTGEASLSSLLSCDALSDCAIVGSETFRQEGDQMTAFIGRREFITLLGGAAAVADRSAGAAADHAAGRVPRPRARYTTALAG